jgi:hypothetical protein
VSTGCSWPASVRALVGTDLNFSLLSHFERVAYLDPEISNRAFKFRVTKKQLHGPEILGAPVNQRSPGATHRMPHHQVRSTRPSDVRCMHIAVSRYAASRGFGWKTGNLMLLVSLR